jgi:hypothetical protein
MIFTGMMNVVTMEPWPVLGSFPTITKLKLVPLCVNEPFHVCRVLAGSCEPGAAGLGGITTKRGTARSLLIDVS